MSNALPTNQTITGIRQDQATVTPDGQPLAKVPHGVTFRPLTTHVDDRGNVCEMYDPRWGWHPEPLVFTYFYTIRPGVIKGWAMHKRHEDRYFIMFGEMEVVLYDAREDSPTFGLVSKIYLSEFNRRLMNIPRGVWHADRNVGSKDVVVVNFPTIPYDHHDPDKYRLPPDTDQIPYKFDNPVGW
ncbi:MAG: dTDP-4-dehydrorhamnose 3,5-epimerase [Anaerolineae bacterium]|nr:dTDP-4-dehydrorhamnose 3,5-epimerase [Anaerolineae bacterium]